MNWMWVAAGVLAGLCFVARKNRNSREAAGDIGNSGGADEKRELSEAIRAGEHALDSLHAVMERLDAARAWGVCDMLGAGAISGKYKYGKIDDANAWVQLANQDLRTFAEELEDVTRVGEYIRPGDMVSSMDIFCEHIAADADVQKRICRAMAQTDSLIVQVGETVELLKKKLDG